MKDLRVDDGPSHITMRRFFDAPIETVWSALTDPEFVALWYGGHGFSNPRCEMDVRPGGRWSHVMRTPDGAKHALEFEFTQVEPPSRLAWRDAADPAGPVNAVQLQPADGGALLAFDVEFATALARAEAEAHGFTPVLEQGFDRMAAVLRVLQDRGEDQ
ncbi:SRPBCC domain-containing protein [Caulobacter sp. UNC358MFTsu5.1]|uniref:SRPBCC family protein n=1 Tax=Caulobacter sp. UNC358MFTsu5.1 TaxID=1449049 RepID=UPI0009DCD404|nr:SRPBCC domain-containing protein [Caulobacter sp. UNC358MFTsu5.1]